MLDELFKPQNRLAVINWEKSYSPRHPVVTFSRSRA